jgi:hypothetical protein
MERIMKFSLNLVFVFVYGYTCAQGPAKNFINFTVGPAFPVGNFGSDKVVPGEYYNGLANTGYQVELGYGRYLKSRWGVGGAIQYASFPRNSDTLFYVYWPPGSEDIFGVKSDPFRLIAFSGSFFYDIHNGKRYNLSVGGRLGVASIFYPEEYHWFKRGTGHFYVMSDNSTGFFYSIYSSFRWNAGKKMDIFSVIGYVHTRARFNDRVTKSWDGVYYLIQDFKSISWPVSAISVQIGLAYKF